MVHCAGGGGGALCLSAPAFRLESLPCVAAFSAVHFKFSVMVPTIKFVKQQMETIEQLFSDTDTATQEIWI